MLHPSILRAFKHIYEHLKDLKSLSYMILHAFMRLCELSSTCLAIEEEALLQLFKGRHRAVRCHPLHHLGSAEVAVQDGLEVPLHVASWRLLQHAAQEVFQHLDRRSAIGASRWARHRRLDHEFIGRAAIAVLEAFQGGSEVDRGRSAAGTAPEATAGPLKLSSEKLSHRYRQGMPPRQLGTGQKAVKAKEFWLLGAEMDRVQSLSRSAKRSTHLGHPTRRSRV